LFCLVHAPPYPFVASSLGGKIVVEFMVRYPEMCNRVVLLCPSGMGDDERLPIVEGVRRNDMKALVESVFYNPRRHADGEMIRFYKRQFPNRRWRSGMLRAVQGTKDHSVRGIMKCVQRPTLWGGGGNDRFCAPEGARPAAANLPQGQFLLIPRCGHAPQIEKAWLINRRVVHFLTPPKPTSKPRLS